MLRHQLRQDLILCLDLLVQVVDPFLLGCMVGPRFRLERSRPVLEELLLPAVEDRGLESLSVTELRDRHLLQEMPPQDGHFLFRRVVLPLLLHAFAPLSEWWNAFSISSRTGSSRDDKHYRGVLNR